MCLFECSNVKSVHVVEKDEETCVYVVGANDSWNGTFKLVTVMMLREDGKFVGIVRHAQSMSVYDIKHVEVSKWGDVMVWVR